METPDLAAYEGLNGTRIRDALTNETDGAILRHWADDTRKIVADKARTRLRSLGLPLLAPELTEHDFTLSDPPVPDPGDADRYGTPEAAGIGAPPADPDRSGPTTQVRTGRLSPNPNLQNIPIRTPEGRRHMPTAPKEAAYDAIADEARGIIAEASYVLPDGDNGNKRRVAWKPDSTVKVCPSCGQTGPVDVVFGFFLVRVHGKKVQRVNSYCRACRAEAAKKAGERQKLKQERAKRQAAGVPAPMGPPKPRGR